MVYYQNSSDDVSKPPPNYVAGLGRGATGFTTRSDIGPAAPGMGWGRGEELEEENQQFEVNDFGVFASTEYDEEADIYERMDSWGKEETTKDLKSNPTISGDFADLKRKLCSMSVDEWNGILEIGDYSMRNKKRRLESFVPIQDTFLEKAMKEKEHVSALDQTDLTSVGKGRGMILSMNLDRVSDSVSGQTVVDLKGYLTGLKSLNIMADTEFLNIAKARLLLKSYTRTNPRYESGWVAAARLEEVAGKLKMARSLIERGCEECPNNEDVWVEACRLASPDEAKSVIARGVKANPNSVKLWLEAAKLEHDKGNKSRVLWKALEYNPESANLWEAVVELANEEDARVLLQRAVECCPLHVRLWIAVARLENYDMARKVLNKARGNLPKERSIWITAAKLEEANGNTAMVEKIIERGISELQSEGVVIDREDWMNDAEACERAECLATCQAIIKHTIGIGVEEPDRKRTWLADAEEFKKKRAVETSRAIYAHALSVFLTKKSIWVKAAELEKSCGTRESFDALLRRAVMYVPQKEVIWLMGAKEKWLAGDVASARGILQEAYAAIPNSEEIWLAAFKLEFENREPERAKMILAEARERGGTERGWMKSAIVERELGNISEEKRLLNEGIQLFPKFFKPWLMLGQLYERLENESMAKKAYESGIENCPNCVTLWLSLAILEKKISGLRKARSVLTMGRKKNPRNPELWLAAIRTELKHGNTKEADNLMAKALQECPNSGILWASHIEMVPRPQRKKTSLDAIRKCGDDDPHVIVAVAKLLWMDRKVDEARSWFTRAVTLAPDVGDFWALYYIFENQFGDEDRKEHVLLHSVAAEPKYGEKWQAVSKAFEDAHLSIEVILMKVVTLIRKEENAAENNNQ